MKTELCLAANLEGAVPTNDSPTNANSMNYEVDDSTLPTSKEHAADTATA
jgi:hypothetical protein